MNQLEKGLPMLINRITTAVESILSDDADVLARLVMYRQQFEKWLQVEVLKRLIRQFPHLEPKIERPYPLGGNERCDLWCREADTCESWVELATCVTNYGQPGKNITQQIVKIIGDCERLIRLPVGANRHLFLLAYPMPANGTLPQQWAVHLSRLQTNGAKVAQVLAAPVCVESWEAAILGYVITPSVADRLRVA
jgi:hypothetical protein